MENIFLSVKRGNVDLFDKEIDKLSEILDSYREEYHLDITDVLNQRLGDDCETLLQRAVMINKRSTFVWYREEINHFSSKGVISFLAIGN